MTHRSTEGETRRLIMLTMLRAGTITATQLAHTLGLSAAGIRRHLDALIDDEYAELVTTKKPSGGRGRPAKAFRLTPQGRALFGHDYDSLAAQALATLRETGGDEAVKAFARKRARDLVSDVDKRDDDTIEHAAHALVDVGHQVDKRDDDTIEHAAHALVDALSRNGYAATIASANHSLQICQHHCPIAEVAAQFPELCEAEHEVIAALLGQHVQPLASIANGNDVCTTNIPLTPNERSDS